MVGSWASMGLETGLRDLALSLALQDAEGRRGERSDEPIVANKPTIG